MSNTSSSTGTSTSSSGGMTPSDSLRARVLAAAKTKPSRTRPQAKRLAVAAIAISVGVAVLVIELAGGVAHSAGRPLSLTIALVLGWALVASFLTWLVINRGQSTLSRRPKVLAAAALAAPIALLVWMNIFYGRYEEPFQRIGYRCLAYTIVIALPPLVAFLLLRRGIEPRRPSALGAGAGAVCGAWAAIAVHLWCPLTNPLHALVGHAAPLALLVVIGALAGSRLLRRA